MKMKSIDIEKLIDSLSVDEMIGQLMCFDLGDKSDEEIEHLVKDYGVGSFFVANVSPERVKRATEIINENLKVPALIAADIECGPGHVFKGETKVTNPMSWGAADDADLVRRVHHSIAKRCRELGVHWSFSPISDINYNPDNPVTNVRAVSDNPERVARICAAAVEGLQEDGLVMAGCKHFPGDGVDDRNQHFCTTVNSLGQKEWMETFGAVYKELFKRGAESVMVGHIALPSYDEKVNDWVGFPPGILSHNLITKLLKGTLGFEGCVVSDALCMVGACSVVPQERLPVEFILAGGDMLLFPTTEYVDSIRAAVKSGEISEERLRDAVYRVLRLKVHARLFEDQDEVLKSASPCEDLEVLTKELAEKSITLVRNYGDIFPLNIKKSAKILVLNIKQNKEPEGRFYSCDLDTVEEELKARGYEVESYTNGNRGDFSERLHEYDLVLINCKMSSQDYGSGYLRIGWEHIAPFWRGAVLQHPRVVFTSFGDPYKIHDFPYVKTYINAYSFSEATQRAFVRAIFGEIPFAGKSPVSYPGYFEEEK